MRLYEFLIINEPLPEMDIKAAKKGGERKNHALLVS